ncbi:2-dehydropantoate 2-reductase [Lysinibacillus capsici]|uniref:ketopantoate reductase family protein n=1 Tax=Lysinibacillus capsici TaxID=2115968 RepID=UPI0001DA5127|nr:2-dehydropantoate 2-reductase [Lysinibacillus capsici]EFI70577.1 putative 2-dehydropantoate 2-reductase [Lysinibacillus fusiformis ZC1]EKU41679.1 putative 2-dehydropantoate 2-reductase [Lysinibacillus fusiformis ZB2]MBU5251699.1 2-dehydropantoate 2-reductase [Lysinibacillus capsici]MED4701516.1 2-dehydropantoate 2-reductase [Lysinibacillus capsici]
MKVAIIGAGAVGQLTASFLAESGVLVTLVARRQEQVNELNAKKLTRINVDGTKAVQRIVATTDLTNLPKQDLLVIAVKYGHLQKLYNQLALFSSDMPLLFMQNGLAHFEEALLLPQKNIAFGSVTFGAQLLDQSTVQHRGVGLCKIAIERGEHWAFQQLLQLQHSLFPIELASNAEQMLFAKAVLNSLINPLTAVLQVKNGELVANQQAFLLLESIYRELTEAFELTISFSDVIDLCRKTANNTSSMLGDRLQGRKSEIETIVGVILNKALANGHNLPTLRTLYHQVLAIEESGERS